jgi:hypothetical protein
MGKGVCCRVDAAGYYPQQQGKWKQIKEITGLHGALLSVSVVHGTMNMWVESVCKYDSQDKNIALRTAVHRTFRIKKEGGIVRHPPVLCVILVDHSHFTHKYRIALGVCL